MMGLTLFPAGVTVSHHCFTRYRERFDATATVEDIADVVLRSKQCEATEQWRSLSASYRPGDIILRHRGKRAVFVIRVHHTNGPIVITVVIDLCGKKRKDARQPTT